MAASTLLVLLLSLGADAKTAASAPFPLPVSQAGRPLAKGRPLPIVDVNMHGDARLTDVCFVDRLHGWAVGDRGTIWHTSDGGQHWRLQASGVACPLRTVWFVDQRIGWAAGGFVHPYTHSSSGVLLATRDGGRHWQRVSAPLLPALRKLRFFDEKHGWAVGCSSAVYPSGVFLSDSGGRSWTPISGENASDWLAADFLDPRTGVLAGRSGTAAMVRRGAIRPARMGRFGLRDLAAMELVAPVHGWLVGDGGLIMMTGDLGASWQSPPGGLPEGMARHFDFHALAVRGAKCWVAGSPGSRVFHTADAGRTWSAAATGVQLPIHALTFCDDEHGWAVGSMGTILATTDGGQTWQHQRSQFARAALLGLFGQIEDVPLELFARLSGNEGYLGVVEVLNRRDVEITRRDRVHPAQRVHEAVVAVGGSGAQVAWRFPLRQAGLGLAARQIIDGWDRANDARGLQELRSHAVRQIRLWRPAVVVTHDASLRGDDPLGHLINQVVLQAVEKAADPTCFTEQISRAGLEPWQVKKVYALLPRGCRAATELTTAQLATRLGRSLADVAATPRGLLDERFTPAAQTLGFRLLVSRLPQDRGRRDFFSGIVLHPGGEARRELPQPQLDRLEGLRRTAQRRRNAQAILEQAEESPQAGSHLLAKTGELTRGLDADSAGRILYQLGQSYHRTGRWAMAAETFSLLAERYPQHPLTRPALLWLVQYYASSEAAWRLQGAQRYTVKQASALSIDVSEQENREDRAAELGKQIRGSTPDLFAEPALRFSLAAAHSKQGFPVQAQRFFMALSHGPRRDAWWECARAEQWLCDPEGQPPKAVLRCARVSAKPRLDGRLEDTLWQRTRAAQLQSARQDDAEWPAAAMLACDGEFLYLAVRCRQAPTAKYEPATGPRPRDGDLSGHDRVDVFLDLDRDFGTYYRFSVDHRGHTAEDCWGDRTWNPTWFVAAETAEGVWTVEAAVPLDQLTGRYPTARDVWAIGIQRTVPGVGFQSWTTPAVTAVMPQGFGYLIFE